MSRGGLGSPIGGSNVYGYLGYVLTLGILPVYVLTNLAAVRYLWGNRGFNPVKHLVLPIAGAGLMVALLIGQIIENSTPAVQVLPLGGRGLGGRGGRGGVLDRQPPSPDAGRRGLGAGHR